MYNMSPGIKKCLFLLLCMIVMCMCSSSRTLRSNMGFTIYSTTDIGGDQILLVLEKSDKTYEIIKSGLHAHYFDRTETGRWRQSHDTLYLYPKWEIVRKGKDPHPRDLSQKENIDCFNMEKRFLVRKKELIGVKTNMPRRLDSIVVAEDWSVFYNCSCDREKLYLVTDFYMKPYNRKVYK